MKENKNTVTPHAALRLLNIVKVYGEGDNKVNALKGISINFRKNEFVSILGPSGCGKTTMLNIIGGLDRYTDGDLIIDGVSTKQYKDGDWDTYRNNRIGFVFQSYNLIPHQTVLSNVELALTLSGVSKEERHERARAALEKVGLTGMDHKLPNQMSGGQMQRVAIARALVNDPEIILADEPTGALDTETSVQVMELLKEVAKDRLVIMVTHNPALAEEYSTRIINLLDGEKTSDSDPFEWDEVSFSAENETEAENNAETIAESGLEENSDKKKRCKKVKKAKSAMSVFTAFALSISNLRTKKGRTILTAVAGSIGIIGIALVLALSTGFSGYINKLQADTLSVYPLTVSEATIDLSDFNKLAQNTITDEVKRQKLTEKVYTRAMFGDLTNMLKSNKVTDEYISYVKDFTDEKNDAAAKTEAGWAYCLQNNYGFDMNNYIYSDIGVNMNTEGSAEKSVMPVDLLVRNLENMFNNGIKNSNMNISAEFVRSYIPTVCEIPESQQLVEAQYDKLYGEWATEEDELLLVVDSYNRVTDITLALLGYRTIEKTNTQTYSIEFGGDSEFTFESAVGKSFYYINNDARYRSVSGEHSYLEYCYDADNLPENATTLRVTGVVRLKDSVEQGVLNTGIAYTSKLVSKVLEDNKSSSIVTGLQNAATGVYAKAEIYSCPSTETKIKTQIAAAMGVPLAMITDEHVKTFMVNTLKSEPVSASFKSLAGSDTVSKLSMYSVDYAAKENLKAYLDEWNNKEGMAEEDKVHYSDSTAMLFSALNSVVDSVKIVLICFTAISLVVSSIMIGIITYVSVVERTKEIGVLRSIGARKKDISRIFNAETFLIGLFAGILGVAVTYLLSIPINLIVGGLVANIGSVCALKITDALILVVVSFALTLIAGVIPARIAAKKDPVVALRSE